MLLINIVRILSLLLLGFFLSGKAYSQSFSVGICYDFNNQTFCNYTPQSDFETDSYGNLRPGSYGSTGMNAADQANAHYQSRHQVPSHIKDQVNRFNHTIQNDTSGNFDDLTKKLFEDVTKLTNGNLDIQFLPASMIAPPLPSDLENTTFKNELKNFYDQTKDNDFESTKNRVNQTIGNLSKTSPNSEDTFWWNEVRRNHTDSNGILTSLPYQNLQQTNFSTPIQSFEGQYVRQEVNNGLASHAQTSFNYLKNCQANSSCGNKHSKIFPVQLSDARNRMLHNGLKVLDENMAWGYDSGDLANLISNYNNSQNQFNQNFPNPSREQLDIHNAESLFSLDSIDREIKSKGQNIAGFTTWPRYRSSNLKNPLEQSNQHSADAATCLAAYSLCEMTGDINNILSKPVIDLGNGPIDPALLKATAKEKQILDLLGMRKKLEGLNFSGVSGGQYLQDLSRYSLIASSAMALNGAMQESDQFKAIGQEVLDIGLGLIPGISVAKDGYELFTGKNLVTGEPLSSADRALAAIGILTLGTGDKLFKGAKILGKGLKAFANSPAMKTATKHAGDIINSGKKLGLETSTRIKDFATSFRSKPSSLRDVGLITDNINKSSSFKNAIDEMPRGKAMFYVNTAGEAIPSTSYKYIDSNSPELTQILSNGKMGARTADKPHYASFNKFDNSTEAMDKLQLAKRPDGTPYNNARYRVEFDTLQHVDNIEVPRGKWGEADYLEPLTKDYPEFGQGGASQIIFKEETKIKEVVDLATGKVVFPID